MKLSTRGRYGLRAVLDLAVHDSDEAVALSQIAERQGISMNYLEQLIPKLKKAGIVRGIRGAQGGYLLAMPVDKISIGDILRALEGDLNPVDCADVNDGEGACSNSDTCVTKYVWKRISDSINEAVDGIMLSELVEESRKLQAPVPNDSNKTKLSCGK
ncbi:MAG: Rrf2 family transcriptional regulator [Clostridiales bacterium]|jgi:Rrf2 family protein|nr:Rrf2 family transcriptional regulator [Clostridiales bacterium]